uniref:Uncharacterized protein n=1 Tax=Plectus sambesii TaxID=2011161 RepID=A0A914X912_9BILA
MTRRELSADAAGDVKRVETHTGDGGVLDGIQLLRPPSPVESIRRFRRPVTNDGRPAPRPRTPTTDQAARNGGVGIRPGGVRTRSEEAATNLISLFVAGVRSLAFTIVALSSAVGRLVGRWRQLRSTHNDGRHPSTTSFSPVLCGPSRRFPSHVCYLDI